MNGIIDINEWAANRNTDLEIAKCIAKMSNGDADKAERIWAEPTSDEVLEVYLYTTITNLTDEYQMPWGGTTLGELLEELAA